MTSELEKTAGYLNQVYYRLELKRAELTHALFHRIFELESGFYNGHYSKREDGSFGRMEHNARCHSMRPLRR